MAKAFSAKQLQEAFNPVPGAMQTCKESLIKNMSACGTIGNLVRTEDSGLASRWNSLGLRFKAIADAIDKVSTELVTQIRKYVQASIQGEVDAGNKLEKVDESGEAIDSAISALLED